MIGVVDINKQINERRSYNSGNAVCYFGCTGYVWYGIGNNKYMWEQQDNGFGTGDTVRMEVEWQKGIARWFVNNEINA